jgi:subtilisin family serine protease
LRLRGSSYLKNTFAYDVFSQSLSSHSAIAKGHHGTGVAAIILGEPTSEFSGGLAPNAELIALSHVDTWTSKTLLTFQLARLEGADIINCSWTSPWLTEPVADVINDLSQYGREGKGSAVVIAAGNNGKDVKDQFTEASIDSAIVVGAHDAQFSPLAISNYGDSVDLFSFGGRVSVPGTDDNMHYLAGTSLAAAVVSGISALLLADEPTLTLKELLLRLHRFSPSIQGGARDKS